MSYLVTHLYLHIHVHPYNSVLYVPYYSISLREGSDKEATRAKEIVEGLGMVLHIFIMKMMCCTYETSTTCT